MKTLAKKKRTKHSHLDSKGDITRKRENTK